MRDNNNNNKPILGTKDTKSQKEGRKSEDKQAFKIIMAETS